jgi:hypothetical protein
MNDMDRAEMERRGDVRLTVYQSETRANMHCLFYYEEYKSWYTPQMESVLPNPEQWRLPSDHERARREDIVR